MRVFVLGTGRCGTTTFSKACSHFDNYTSGHETKTKNNDLLYKNNHIECDPHLFWQLPNLIELYTDDMFIHIQRDRSSCIESLLNRPSLQKYQAFTEMTNTFDAKQVATKYYDFCTKTIDIIINSTCHNMKMNLSPSKDEWTKFCKLIGEESNIQSSFSEWAITYNKR